MFSMWTVANTGAVSEASRSTPLVDVTLAGWPEAWVVP